MRKTRPPGRAVLFYACKERGIFLEMVNSLLCCRGFHDIIDTKNKNAAAYGCANTRKPAQVRLHLYNGSDRIRMGYYTTFHPCL